MNPQPSDGVLRRRRGSRRKSEQPEVADVEPGRSLVASLWLQSRAQPQPALASSPAPLLKQGEDRPVTFKNSRIAVSLVGLLWGRFLGLFWQGYRLRIAAFLISRVIKGVLPAARIWASSAMLDLVQRSFEDKALPTPAVIRFAVVSLLLSTSDDIFSYVSQTNDNIVRTHLNTSMERAYLAAQLSLSIPALSSPYVTALMYEAGVFAGFELRSDRMASRYSGGPYETIQSVFSLLTLSVDVASQATLLLRTLTANAFSRSTILLLVLTAAFSLLRFFERYILFWRNTRRFDWIGMRRDANAIKDLGRNGGYKQEIVLFGLSDWVLTKWEALKVRQVAVQATAKHRVSAWELSLGIGSESVQTAFLVLLATRGLQTSLSLGSIRLYQRTTATLMSRIQRSADALESAYQSVFYFAAFCEAVDHAERARAGDPNKIDYETVRTDGGMRIEAVNLGFTYPGTDRPVLRNINLTVEPGQTLAIVGFNGGGKTTLVKALMGLYDHSGSLRINGVPTEQIDPTTLHRRTSCLFQDFGKYSLSLRENVGLGDVDRIDDTEAIERAIVRGGAEGVRDKVGLDGALNRHGVPDTLGAGDGGDVVGNAGGEEDLGPPPGRKGGPGGGGRGGKGGKGGKGGRGGFGGGRLGSGPPPGPPDGMPPPGDLMPDALAIFDRKVGDNKTALSGGQWQRVALSRAFLRADEADLVVFDEPSAALDPKAEAELFQRIHALALRDGQRRSTTIYISHRFSTVRNADVIAFVEDGTITECGNHAQLIALNGRYAELFNLQKAGFSDA
ncbi:hypothetical protein Q5752_000275 [Cryptotrichosporon argae]